MCAAAGIGMRKALILVPAIDYKNVFGTSEGSYVGDMIKTLKKTHEVAIVTIESLNDFNEALKANGKYSILVICGHGKPKIIEVNKEIYYETPNLEDFDNLTEDGIIFTYGCETGKEIDGIGSRIGKASNRLTFSILTEASAFKIYEIHGEVFGLFYENHINPFDRDITRIFIPSKRIYEKLSAEDISKTAEKIASKDPSLHLEAYNWIDEKFKFFLYCRKDEIKNKLLNRAYIPLIKALIQDEQFEQAVSLIYQAKFIVGSCNQPLDENFKLIQDELFNIALRFAEKGQIDEMLEICCKNVKQKVFSLISVANFCLGKIAPEKLLKILNIAKELANTLPDGSYDKITSLLSIASFCEGKVEPEKILNLLNLTKELVNTLRVDTLDDKISKINILIGSAKFCKGKTERDGILEILNIANDLADKLPSSEEKRDLLLKEIAELKQDIDKN